MPCLPPYLNDVLNMCYAVHGNKHVCIATFHFSNYINICVGVALRVCMYVIIVIQLTIELMNKCQQCITRACACCWCV